MNRDREALIEAMKSSLYLVGRAGLGSGHYAAIAGHEKAADAILALPPAGGVEEALRELLEAVNWRDEPGGLDRLTAAEELAAAALSPTTLGGRSGSAQDGLPPARSLPSALTSAGPATGADQ